MAGGVLMQATQDSRHNHARRPVEERVFAVTVAGIQLGPVTPVVTAYGHITSGETLQLRAAATGKVVRLAADFRDGGRVESGDLLFAIDPADAASRLATTKTQLAEAQAEAAEAELSLTLEQAELQAARKQNQLRAAALARARETRERGFDTATAVETAELAQVNAEQSVITRRQAIARTQARITRAHIAVERLQIALQTAQRGITDTQMHAPFDGILSEIDANLGQRVNNGEKLGELINVKSLEVAFRISSQTFSRLVDDSGALRAQPVDIHLDVTHGASRLRGRIDRVSAQIGAGQTGRLVYARLQPPLPATLSSGDFVTVRVYEPPINAVAAIAVTAAEDDGRVLLVDTDNRLRETRVTIVRRQGKQYLVRGLAPGDRLVTVRRPQLGPGVRVKPVHADPS